MIDNSNNTDLYLQISNGLKYENIDNKYKTYTGEDKNWKTRNTYSSIKTVPENLIKIEETTKKSSSDIDEGVNKESNWNA